MCFNLHLSFLTRKVIVKTFGFVLHILHSPFDEDFFVWGMNVMLQFQEFTGLRISVPPSVETDYGHVFHEIQKGRLQQSYSVPWIYLLQASLYFWLDSDPQPDIHRASPNGSFINYIF